jgi:hypothetical protein
VTFVILASLGILAVDVVLGLEQAMSGVVDQTGSVLLQKRWPDSDTQVSLDQVPPNITNK